MNWKDVAAEGLPVMLREQAEWARFAIACDEPVQTDLDENQILLKAAANYLTKQTLNEVCNMITFLTSSKADSSELLTVLLQQIKNMLKYLTDFASRLLKVFLIERFTIEILIK